MLVADTSFPQIRTRPRMNAEKRGSELLSEILIRVSAFIRGLTHRSFEPSFHHLHHLSHVKPIRLRHERHPV